MEKSQSGCEHAWVSRIDGKIVINKDLLNTEIRTGMRTLHGSLPIQCRWDFTKLSTAVFTELPLNEEEVVANLVSSEENGESVYHLVHAHFLIQYESPRGILGSEYWEKY